MAITVVVAVATMVLQRQVVSASTYSQAVLADTPSIYYRLDETSGTTATDSSGNAHNGTYNYSQSPGSCCWGLNQNGALANDTDTAAYMDGQRLVYPSGTGLPQGNSAGTFEEWFKTGGTGCAFGLGNSGGNPIFDLCLQSSVSVQITTPNGSPYFATRPIADGNWHLVDVVYGGGSTITLYVDGQAVGTASGGGFGTPVAFIVGDRTTAAASWSLYATYDEVAVYNTALTATQVQNHFVASGDSAPTAPGNVTATAGQNSVSATWSASTAGVPTGATAVTGYIATAYAGTQQAGSIAVGGSATSATITGLPAGTPGTSAAVTPTGASTTYASTILQDQPAVYYRLGDSSGNIAADSSGGGHNGTYGYSSAPGGCCWSLNQSSALAGDADTSASLSGYRMVFPYGSGLPQSNGPATLETWIRTGGTGCMLGLGDVNGNPMFNVCLVDQTRVTIATPSLTQWFASKRLTDGAWHLIDAVYDGSSTVSLYVDGQLAGTGSGGGLGASGAFILGDRTNAAGAWALGSSYDEAAVYTAALSADRIAAHFAASGDTVPTAPGNVSATGGANQVTVSWSAASATVPSGMSAVTGYVATAYAGATPIASRAAAATATSITLTGLPSGQSDTVSVVAVNAFGSGPAGSSAAVVPTGAATTYASTIRADGATVYYRVGDTGGSLAADSSGQGRLGFYNYTSAPGACCWSLGAAGVVPNDGDTAAALNGDRLVWPYGTGVQGAGARTLEVWFKTTGSGCAIGFGDGNGNPMFDACIVGGSQIQLQTPATSTTFNTAHPLNDGIWHLLDITYDGASTAAVYVDSQLVGTAQAGGMSTPSAFIVGDRTTAAGAYALNATFDEAAVYPTALTATQILNHYSVVGPIAAPGNVTAVGGPNSAVVHWDAPSGSSAVSSYVVTPFVNGVAQTPTRVDPSLTSVALRNLSANTAYTFQVDAVANGTYGYAASSNSASSQTPLVIQQPTPLDLGVFVGYSDLRQGGFRPSPWNGDPGIAGGGSDDQGAILLRNPTPNAISASVSIDIGTWHYSAGSGSVPAFGGLILATTDTSDLAGCTYSSNAAQIHVTVNGITVTYGDGGLVLTSGGADKSNCLNQTEAQNWAQVGGPATTLESLRNPSEMSCHCQSADPVDTATGDYNETATDLSIPGRGISLSVQRQYNSLMSGYNGPFGYGWAFDYGMALVQEPTLAANLVTVLQENGTPVTFTRQADGSYVPPGRVLATLVRNADGTYTFTRRAREHFVFAADGHLLSESDLNGYATTLQYSTSGQLTAVTDPTSRSLSFAYDGNGHVQTVTDSTGRVVTYTYDASGNLQQVQDVDGGLTVYGYDSQHLLTSVRDPRGHAMSNTFDTQGRVTQQQDRAQAPPTQFAYSNGTTTVTDPMGKATVDTYANGELASQTRGYGSSDAATWSYQYDPVTQGVTQITDPNSHATHQTFDAHGNLLTVTDALNRTTTFTYDGLSDVTSVTDPTQEKTTYTYDGAGNLLSASRPLAGTSSTQTVTYDRTGSAHPEDVTALVDPNGKTWHYTYDTHGYLASAADPLGDRSTFTYDGAGRRLTEVTPRGNAAGATPSAFTWTWTYDHYGSVLSVTDPLGNVTGYQYDANHNLTLVTDPKTQSYANTYDFDDRLTSTTRPDSTVVKTQYDADGNISLQQDGLQSSTPSSGTSYAYDHQNRLAGVTDPLGRTTGYTYDGTGNVVSKQDPGGSCTSTPQTGCTAYAYDAANELTGITFSDGSTPNVSGIQYDANGRRTSMTSGTQASTWRWDSLGRLQQYTNGAGATVGYTYDLGGNVATVAYPGAGTVTRTVDDAGRLKTVADWGPAGQAVHTTTFGYDPSGNLASEVYPNGVTASFTYDAADRMNGVTDATAQNVALFGLTYTRDANGDLTQATPAGVIGTPATYQYDALARLTSATQQSYTYDAADNLTGVGSGTLHYDSANELTSMTPVVGTPTTYSYDSRGNRTAASGGLNATYGYDQASRLTSFSGSGVSAQYAYDGTGLRTSKTVNGVTTPFVWDVTSRIPALLEDGGTQYVYGANGWPVEEITSGGTVYYLHQDEAGSTRLVTDASATAAQTETYDGYGNVVASTGSQVTHLLFDGQYTDPETGFEYLRARYYDPSTGQFLSRDPLAALTRQPYLFSAGDPTNGADPSGLSPLDFANGLCDSLLIHACGTVESWFGAGANQCSSDYSSGFSLGIGASAVFAVVSLGTDFAADASFAAQVSPTIEVDGARFIYGNRVLARAAEEAGPYHNFPSTFDQVILSGNREVVSEGYIRYTVPGSINGVGGVYEIGTQPTALGKAELIIHRFFNPGG